MGEVYWGCFAAEATGLLSALGPPAVGPPAAVRLPEGGTCAQSPPSESARWRGIGRGFAAHPGAFGHHRRSASARMTPALLPQAREMARLGAVRSSAGGGIDPAFLEPLYVRDKVALTEAERGIERGVGK